MSGTVVTREIYEGQFVKEGDKLFELADFFTMWFQFDLYERDLAWVRVGQAVEITVPSVPGKKFNATVSFIDPNLNDMTRSARVRVELQNPLITVQGKARRELLHKLDALGRAAKGNFALTAFYQSEDQAYDMILGDGAKAFDLSQETDEVRGSNTL